MPAGRGVGRRAFGARGLLALIFLVSVGVRMFAAGRRSTPLYYPDEYIYSALARSIASTGVPRLRGDVLHFSSLLVPYLMAPAWLIGNVHTAYHVVLDLGAVWFSAAVFPAYALARRLGVSERGSVVAALLAVLVPDAAFATNAMTEPYAYPIFLATVFVAIDAIVSPTRRRQIAVLLLMGALCFARVQFAFVLVLYFAAALVQAGGSARRALRAQSIVASVLLGGIVLIAAVGPNKLVGFYSLRTNWSLLQSSLGPFAVNLFVLAIAAGWVVAPGALLGVSSLVRSGNPTQKVFAIFLLGTTAALIVEATYVDAIRHGVHERYTFYAAPLLITAFVWAAEFTTWRRVYSVAAYALAATALLLPASDALRSASSEQSPTLLGLQSLGGNGSGGRLVWAAGLSLAALAVGLSRGRPFVPAFLALLIATSVGAAGTRALLHFATGPQSGKGRPQTDAFRLAAPSGSALVTWAGTDRLTLMQTLFWSPSVDRVLVIGGGGATDKFSATSASFRSPAGIVNRAGRPVDGPFALGPDTTLASRGSTFVAGLSRVEWLRSSPRGLILGLDRKDGFVASASELLVASGGVPLTVSLRLVSADIRRTLTFDCRSGRFDVVVGRVPKLVSIKLGATETARCRISLTRGAAVQEGHRITSGVKALRFTVSETAS